MRNNPRSMIGQCVAALVEAEHEAGEVTSAKFSRICIAIAGTKETAKSLRKDMIRRGYARRVIAVTASARARHKVHGARPMKHAALVDGILSAVSDLVRSGPNFDGRWGELERLIWQAIETARKGAL
jgi:hypothetical protein